MESRPERDVPLTFDQLTLAEAAQMMREAVKDKSYRATPVGLEVAHFIRWFRNEYGATPSTLRDYEAVLARNLTKTFSRHGFTALHAGTIADGLRIAEEAHAEITRELDWRPWLRTEVVLVDAAWPVVDLGATGSIGPALWICLGGGIVAVIETGAPSAGVS